MELAVPSFVLLLAWFLAASSAPAGDGQAASGEAAVPAGAGLRLDAAGRDMAEPSAEALADYSGPGPMVTPDLAGIAPIASDFDPRSQMKRSQSPVKSGDGPIGAFRFICQPGQVNWDDPIAYPGRPGASPHLHQWFGNTGADALSSYATLRRSGDSTCMGPLNRSAYWIPAMLAGEDTVVRPDYVSIYYKRYPRTSPECSQAAKACLPLPRGLRYIFGFDHTISEQLQPYRSHLHWKCVMPDNRQRGEGARRFDRLDCRPDDLLIVTLSAPGCWDGRNLDSPDHRSHMAYRRYGRSGGPPTCPSSHPYLMPEFTIGVVWRIATTDRVSDWHLSSDRMPGMKPMPAGTSFHSDWYGAWDDLALRTWTQNCIERKLSCVDGQLGDGTIMKRPEGYGLVASPRLVRRPQRPAPREVSGSTL